MYTVQDLKDKLSKNNSNIDTITIASYLKSWRVDPVYEDENNVEYYDEIAIIKLNQGLKLKEQGMEDKEILSIVNNGMIPAINAPAVRKTEVQAQTQPEKETGLQLKNITVDITTQTLTLLAESIAQKISNDITTRIKENDIFQPVMDSAKLRRDNEVLSGQVQKLIGENKKLIERINFLQQENAKFKHVVGNFYMKQQ